MSSTLCVGLDDAPPRDSRPAAQEGGSSTGFPSSNSLPFSPSWPERGALVSTEAEAPVPGWVFRPRSSARAPETNSSLAGLALPTQPRSPACEGTTREGQ